MDFGITFDYLCPFARNANEAALAGVDRGEPWNPRFHAFSLAQVHLEPGERAVWETDDRRSGVLALEWGIAVRDGFPELFSAVHRALFAARHDHGLDIKDPAVVTSTVAEAGADPDAVAARVATGEPLATLAEEHTAAVERWAVFGVPTILMGDEAVFVRFMRRGDVDDLARALDLVGWTHLNEFKRTRVPR